MPGIVTQAAVATVLPVGLASLYVEALEWPCQQDGPYADGSTNRRVNSAESRRSWQLERRCTPSEFNALVGFFSSRKGPQEAFYFYPVKAQHDPTGVLTTGRNLVRFASAMQAGYSLGRDPLSFSLIEIR